MQRGLYTAIISLFALILAIGILSISAVKEEIPNNMLIMKSADLRATINEIIFSFDKAFGYALVMAVKKKYIEDLNCELPENAEFYIRSYFSDILRDVSEKKNMLCSFSFEDFQNGKPLKIAISCSYLATKGNIFWFDLSTENEFYLGKEVLLQETATGCEIKIRDIFSNEEEISKVIASS